jgi:hypothetical protein
VLHLAAVNVLGAVVFAGVYALAATARVPRGVFPATLAAAFIGTTALWLRVERRSRGVDPLRRLGRGAAGLVLVVVGLPVAVLLPLFWVESHLPPGAVGALHLGPAMALLLISLVLVVVVNAVGTVMAVAAAVARRWRAGRPGP